MAAKSAWVGERIAGMESFFSRLKVELVYSEDYHSIEDSKSGIFEYIEIFYNRTYIFSFKLNSFWFLQFFNFNYLRNSCRYSFYTLGNS